MIHCKPVIQTVVQKVPELIGVTYEHAAIACVSAAVIAAAIAWFLTKYGVTSIENEIASIKSDISTLKAKNAVTTPAPIVVV